MDLDSVRFDLQENLSQVINTLALRAKQKRLKLSCNVLPDVPMTMIGDPSRLRQVLVNLIGNALKFTEQGEITVNVERGDARSKETTLHFSVCDTGIGIPIDKQRTIFDAFSQADSSTTRKYGGTGLGLTISARLVHLMGGRIWVESELGKGSAFHFTVEFAPD